MAAEPYLAAVVQHPPALLDRDATVERACELIAEAAGAGARLIAFSESHVPGYPGWLFGTGTWEDAVGKRLHRRLMEEALEIGSPACRRLQDAARRHDAMVVIGATERETRFSRGTLFNSLLFIGPDGTLLGVHRKLVPTHAERLTWAQGDAHGLHPHETALGRVGGLICWEHWMPLARFTLHAAGEQVHVAVWPEVNEIHHIASRHYAFEARAFVLCAGQLLRTSDLPDDPELRQVMLDGLGDLGGGDAVILPGGAGIIGPDGAWVAGPAGDEPTIVYGQIDLARIAEEQLALDTAGHYHRPDLFAVDVRTDRLEPLTFDGGRARRPERATPRAADPALDGRVPRPAVDAGQA